MGNINAFNWSLMSIFGWEVCTGSGFSEVGGKVCGRNGKFKEDIGGAIGAITVVREYIK